MGYYLGMKHKIKNLTNSPYALSTVDGALTVPARGEVVAEFDAHQLHAVKSVGYFKVEEVADGGKAPSGAPPVVVNSDSVVSPKRGRPRKDS